MFCALACQEICPVLKAPTTSLPPPPHLPAALKPSLFVYNGSLNLWSRGRSSRATRTRALTCYSRVHLSGFQPRALQMLAQCVLIISCHHHGNSELAQDVCVSMQMASCSSATCQSPNEAHCRHAKCRLSTLDGNLFLMCQMVAFHNFSSNCYELETKFLSNTILLSEHCNTFSNTLSHTVFPFIVFVHWISFLPFCSVLTNLFLYSFSLASAFLTFPFLSFLSPVYSLNTPLNTSVTAIFLFLFIFHPKINGSCVKHITNGRALNWQSGSVTIER